ncbi:MAG: glycosyltransferase [Nitrospirae bacterium]|nr:glycosyltransferase [Nitrospirota bacterium]
MFLLMVLSLAMILATFFLVPILCMSIYVLKGPRKIKLSTDLPYVSIILVTRNAGDVICDKLRNTLSLDYPKEKLEVIVFLDGSTDDTSKKAESCSAENVTILSGKEHIGKHNGMNVASRHCKGELLAFTDVDVTLGRDSLLKIVRYFGDKKVGGVCGNKLIAKKNYNLEDAQDTYMKLAGKVKLIESHVESISSNDGTLYVIRKELFRDVPPAVTDDLFVCLTVVAQNYRFMYEPGAKAFMDVPSTNPGHEIRRRRRIVSRSLRGIFIRNETLNPFKYGSFAISLFVNKVLRRLNPVFLLLLFITSLTLAPQNDVIKGILFLQLMFYCLAASYLTPIKRLPVIGKAASFSFYFSLGNYGTLMGVIDFLAGRKIAKW